ncbi:hypothetical protein [Bradyrhizobium cenepequi]
MNRREALSIMATSVVAITVPSDLAQWNRLPGFNGGHDLRQPPYPLVRSPITPIVRLG